MRRICLRPARAFGRAAAPPSKSVAHRALIAAALSGGGCVRGITDSQDMAATLRCLSAMGSRFLRQGQSVRFFPLAQGDGRADCGESGSTLRFLMPVFAALGKDAVFTGSGRLPSRPLGVYDECLPAHGVSLTRPKNTIRRLSGRLRGGRYTVAGDISSQFITGLLFALPLCDEDSEITLNTPLQSKEYVAVTLDVLARAGIAVFPKENGWSVPGRQVYAPADYTVEGDWSQAAFWLTAGAVGGQVAVTGLNGQSPQGDKRITEILRRMGADIRREDSVFTARKAPLRGCTVDCADIPDLVPALCIAAAAARGETRFVRAERLRAKESDRIRTCVDMLRALGAEVGETADGLTVRGRGGFSGGTVNAAGDHRLAMSAAVASFAAGGPVTVEGAESVGKSWPEFFEEIRRIGGDWVEL